MDGHSENFNKENIRKYQIEVTGIRHTKTKLKNTQHGFNSRLDEAEEGSVTSKQGSGTHSIGAAKRKKKNEKSKDSLRDLWDNVRWFNIHIIGLPEGEDRKGQKSYLKK